VDGARIAIVDDVLTTGSTLASVASELRAAGASAVCGLVLARTPSLPQPRKRAWT
jgi:predicted amidophosphoribosyltransferase